MLLLARNICFRLTTTVPDKSQVFLNLPPMSLKCITTGSYLVLSTESVDSVRRHLLLLGQPMTRPFRPRMVI